MEHKPSLVGGACIIAGVCVGAGMLGLPSAGAGAWTIWSILGITLTMVVMTVSGWMLLESYSSSYSNSSSILPPSTTKPLHPCF